MMITAGPSNVVDFEAHRRALTGLAYRMLGSRAEAEDVVQDATTMAKLIGPDFIALQVRDLKTSERFYTEHVRSYWPLLPSYGRARPGHPRLTR
jgi:hypothetical protein